MVLETNLKKKNCVNNNFCSTISGGTWLERGCQLLCATYGLEDQWGSEEFKKTSRSSQHAAAAAHHHYNGDPRAGYN